jgi:peptidylprolyl isomerase
LSLAQFKCFDKLIISNMNRRIYLFLLAFLAVSLAACGNEAPDNKVPDFEQFTSSEPGKQAVDTGTAPEEQSNDAGKMSIDDTNTKDTQMELKIETLKEGTGERSVKPGDTISVHYTGTLLDGSKFDSSLDRGQPFVFQIGQGMVIRGWDEGLLGMKVGEKRKLTIPSEMGYGSRGAGSAIPPNATLVFETELMEIK